MCILYMQAYVRRAYVSSLRVSRGHRNQQQSGSNGARSCRENACAKEVNVFYAERNIPSTQQSYMYLHNI